MFCHRKQTGQNVNGYQRPRSSTIISPTRYIYDYDWRSFTGLLIIGCLLAFVAGYVNTICIVGAFRLPLTALTGTTSKMVIVLAQARFDIALHFGLLIFAFVLGSSISGALVGGSSFRIQRHYGLVLLLESMALAFGSLFENIHWSPNGEWEALIPSAYLISLAAGLQNGMCTTFSGAVIRTTHVTGILTDIGLIIGHAIFHKRTRKHLWKLKLLVPIYVAFCCGGITGWFAHELLHKKEILLPCGIVTILGFGHISYCKVFLNFKLREIKNTNEKIYGSTRLSVVASETITEPNIAFDKQSSDTEPIDSEDEENEPKKSSEIRNSFTPLMVTVYDVKSDHEGDIK